MKGWAWSRKNNSKNETNRR